jgi:putative oxidoreductase
MESKMSAEPAIPEPRYTGPATARFTALDVGLFLIRLLPGIVFMFHGSQKLFGWFGGSGIAKFAGFLGSQGVPLPTVAATIAALVEFLGGLALITGVGTRARGAFIFRAMSLLLFFTMAVASLLVHRHAFSAQQGGMEYPLTLAFIALGLAIAGPGSMTLQAAFRGVKSKNAR